MKQSSRSYLEHTTSLISVGVQSESKRFRSILYSTNQLHGEHKVDMGGGGGGFIGPFSAQEDQSRQCPRRK